MDLMNMGSPGGMFTRQDLHFAGSEGLAARGPERDAPDEAGAFEPGAVGGEGQERVASRTTPPARRVMLNPQNRARQVREAGGETVPDHLGGQPLDHPGASLLGQLAAQDHRRVAGIFARVDPDPAPSHPVAVTPTLMDVVVQGFQLANPLLVRTAA